MIQAYKKQVIQQPIALTIKKHLSLNEFAGVEFVLWKVSSHGIHQKETG